MSDTSEKLQLKRGVMVEFDFAVLNGHQMLFDCLAKRLNKEGITLDFGLVARCLYGRSFSAGLNALAERLETTIDVNGVVADTNAAFTEALRNGLDKVPASFLEFIKEALARDLRVVIVSRLEEDDLRGIFSDLDNGELFFYHDTASGFGSISWDTLHRAVRRNSLFERLTLAVVASGYAAKNALTCGMGVMARPDKSTEYQDYSGCDRLIADYAAQQVDDVLMILRA